MTRGKMMENKNFVKVYYADFSAFDEATIAARICEISDERRARIEKAARTETKLELLASGLLAKKAVSIVFGIENPEFVKNKFGKPYIAGHTNCFFNISHSGKRVICALSDSECGVDIEKIEAPAQIDMIASKFFSIYERNAVMLSANPVEAFTRLWTLREAYVKMRGKGFDIPLASLSCTFPHGKAHICEYGKVQEDAVFHEIRDIYGYRATVCTFGEKDFSLEKTEI